MPDFLSCMGARSVLGLHRYPEGERDNSVPHQDGSASELGQAFRRVRPLTMLEDSLKAIEGPVARRKTKARHAWPDGTVNVPFNLAGEISKRTASEVLYIDVLICEDAMLLSHPH